MDDFIEVYAVATGRKQRVPRHFLDDPMLGAGIRKTPSQRELDGELGPRPTEETLVKDIDAWAEDADVDLSGLSTKTEKLTAVEAVFEHADVQGGLVPAEPDPLPADPLAPAVAAQNLEPGVPTPVPSDSDGDQPLGDPDTPPTGDDTTQEN
jgi:hypothetical protein